MLLLEDNRELLARSRQEKLAAMGRVSAGIAHEIRNPLAAIAQANALLSEDLVGSRNEQLTQMIGSNVQRLKRLVDDVMEVAPGVGPTSQPLDAAQLLRDVVEDWVRINGLAGSGRFAAALAGRCNGAVRARAFAARAGQFAGQRAAPCLASRGRHPALAGRGGRRPGALELVVYSAAPAIAPEIERHLFEPFFSTRSPAPAWGSTFAVSCASATTAASNTAAAAPSPRAMSSAS